MTPDRGSQLLPLYAVAFDSMQAIGPSKLLRRVRSEAELNDVEDLASPEVLLEALSSEVGASPLAARLRTELSLWDSAASQPWVDGTEPKTDERRALIYQKLELPPEIRHRLDELVPVAKDGAGVVVSQEFEPWYADTREERPPFYWAHYRGYLLAKGWHPDAVANLDLNTTRVVERLADPQRVAAYQAKGLVVGYVQSGKTANFTGVLAKAIDAGYRLIIVLTGTTDLLRNQTQRRLDKELVGRENLLRGADPDDPDAVTTVDYFGDPDWDAFVSHGVRPSSIDRADIYRLTTRLGDYKELKTGIEALDFARVDQSKPLNAPENLRRVPARLAVVKKNTRVLGPLVRDLKKITAKLGDIPALIIDDESDQASVNTSNPKKWQEGQKERSAINGYISDLIRLLPRGQYVGYTATPFANVFVDPSDSADIFPRDFLLSLDRPPDYMGARDFHDLDGFDGEMRTAANSNEAAFVRAVTEDDADIELRRALDAFVLSGAIKRYRSRRGSDGSFRHHTMLVHESVNIAAHRELADRIRALWNASGWYTPKGRARLEELYLEDFVEVMDARADGEPIPGSFDDLHEDIGWVVGQIAGTDNNPVWIINGDKDVAEQDIDFDARAVWKILVGGTKLSRGFTVEGLTVSYYRRATRQADTLMQMGRWFGFRRGYRDLVRLYIARREPGSKGGGYDVYEAFEAACQSEELFREELKKYAVLVNGVPQITPADVAPLVAQHVPWLKPAAPSKMYNAELVERRSPGTRLEPAGYPGAGVDRKNNAAAVRPLFESATRVAKLRMRDTGQAQFTAFVGTVEHRELVDVLAKLRWAPADHFAADYEWLRKLTPEQIRDWLVLLPQLEGTDSTRTVFGQNVSVFRRKRRLGRALFGAISDPKHRLAAGRIAGNANAGADTEATSLHAPRRGALLLYPVFEIDDDATKIPSSVEPEDLVMALVLVSPGSTGSPDGTLVRFRARDETRASEPIIDAPQT